MRKNIKITLKIGPGNVPVEFVDFRSSKYLGQFRMNKSCGEVLVSKDTHGWILVDTMIHEIVHAFIGSWGLPCRNEEALVRQVTPLIVRLFQDNPHLLDFLSELFRKGLTASPESLRSHRRRKPSRKVRVGNRPG